MTRKIKGAVALGTAAVVVAAGIFAYGTPNQKAYGDDNVTQVENKITDTLKDSVTVASTTGADKEETVYVISDANGKVSKKIVSSWLKNKDGAATIDDVANLTDIENVKGDEDFETGDNGKITWNADGSDIYYQGTSDAELPVDVKVTYLLDGKEIAPDDLAGKSGKVTIKFEYTNNSSKEVEINGKKEKIVTPFVMVSGMVLPTDTFKNVEVTNGKVITDGDKAIVVGMGFPGLNDDLSLSLLSKDLDIDFPESFEVTADVEDFSLMMTITLGSSDIFSTVDVDESAGTDEISSLVKKATDALNQMADGTGQLSDGLTLLNTKLTAFQDATKTFQSGLKEYTSYVDKFDTGAAQIATATSGLNEQVPKLVAGINELNAGMSLLRQKVSTDKKNTTLLAGATSVNAGVKTLYTTMDTMYKTIGTNIKTYNANIKKLTNGISKAKKTLSTAADGVKQYKEGVAQLKTAAEGYAKGGDLQQAVGYYAQLNTTYESLTAVYDQMVTGYESLIAYEEQLGQCEGAVAALSEIQGQMDKGQLMAKLKTLKDGTAAIQKGVQQLSDTLKDDIAPGVQKLADSVKDMPAGISTLNGYITQLSSGLTQVAANSKDLNDGAAQILSAEEQLQDGVGKLQIGTGKLSSGIDDFKKQTIDQLSEALDGDVETVIERVNASADAAKEYTSFSGIADGKDGSVKFIYRTDEIK